MSINPYSALDYAREILGDFAVFIGIAVLLACPFIVVYMKVKGRNEG